MARQLMVALAAAVGTVPVRPAVLTRKRSANVGAVGAVAATTSIRTVVPISICAAVVVPVVVVVVVVGAATTGTIAHERHEVAHLGKESRFAGGKSGLAGQKSSVLGNGGKHFSWNGRIGVRWKRGKKAFGYKISHDGCVGLIGVVEISSSGEVLEIRLGSSEVDDHFWPGLVNSREFGPGADIGLQSAFLGKNDIGKIFHLFGGDGSTTMGGKVDEVIDGVKDNVNRSADGIRHVGDGGLLSFHLLRGDSSIGSKKMG